MEGKLLDLDETPIPIKRPIVSRDVFDADFELAEAYGAARREDKPKIVAVVEKKEDTAPPKKKIQQQLDRGDFNESRTIFKTGGFEEQPSPKSYYTRFAPIGGGSGMPSPPRPTHSSISGRLRGSSSGFGSSSMTVGVTPRPLFPNNIVPGENQFDWKMSSAMTGFGCSNEDIARLPGRTRGYRGNRRGASGRGRNSEYSYKSMTGANNNSDGETNKNLTNGGAQSSPESLTTRRNRAFGVPSLTGRRASAFGEELSGLLEVPPKKPRRPSSTCTICGKMGHLAEDCYSSAVTPKTEVRCYNCNQYGHYAVRCPRSPTIKRPPGSVSRPAAWRATGGAGAAATRQCPEARGQKEKPQNKPSESEKKGLEVICKLMKDKHLREETAKTAPEVYDEMLSYMIAHVNLSPAKNTSNNHC